MLSELAANACADAIAALLDGGSLCIYAQDDRLLAELRFRSPAFARARSGVAIARGLAPDEDAKGSGVAAWYQCKTARGEPVLSGMAGGAGAELALNSAEIRKGAEVSIDEYRLTAARQ